MSESPFDVVNEVPAAVGAGDPVVRDGWTIGREHFLLDLVEAYDRDNDARSVQRHIGPSEIGSPCVRRLALKALHAPEASRRIAWRTRVGTAVHEWLAHAVAAAAGPGVLVTEVRLYLDGEGDDELSGTTDVLVLRAPDGEVEVVDWKIPGPTTMDKARRGRVNVGYRTQGQVYGRMVEETFGLVPARVTIIFLPAAGEFHQAVVASRPYDRGEAEEAIRRYKTIRTSARRHGLAETVRRTRTKVADDFCSGCPYLGVRVPVGDDGEVLTLCHGYSEETRHA